MKLKFRKYTICVLIADLGLIACSFIFFNLSTFGNNQKVLDAFEAFFRYKFENNDSGAQQNAEAYFLEIAGKDPSSDFLARFDGHAPRVKKGSEFIEGSMFLREGEDIIENNGILFRIDSCKWVGLGWITRNHVEIYGGYYEGWLSASGNSYIWVRKKGKWTLKSKGIGWIAKNSREPEKTPAMVTLSK